jgi:hypothetical protein
MTTATILPDGSQNQPVPSDLRLADLPVAKCALLGCRCARWFDDVRGIAWAARCCIGWMAALAGGGVRSCSLIEFVVAVPLLALCALAGWCGDGWCDRGGNLAGNCKLPETYFLSVDVAVEKSAGP